MGQALPLTRLWCIFEVVNTCKLQEDDKSFQGLVYCTFAGVLGIADRCGDVAAALGDKLVSLRLEDAECSMASDKKLIHDIVQSEGGFTHMNAYVKTNMLTTLQNVHNKVESDFQELERRLRGLSSEPKPQGDCANEPSIALPSVSPTVLGHQESFDMWV